MKIFQEANLDSAEVALIPTYIEGDIDFYGSSAYEKLYEYFTLETGEMPYGTAKARDGDPVDWILDRLEEIVGESR